MSVRPLFLFLCLALTPALSASDLTIVRVFTGWRAGDSFKRIAEYFDGKEHSGSEIILRTHPAQRTGYYFLVRLKNPGAARPVHFQLELIAPGTGASRTVDFPAELGTDSPVYQLGLTGPEWQDPKVQPTAWRLRVLGENDQVLATEKSYLWEKPADK
ncbi:MAG TPA: hypothetical protein VF388_02100 [Lacunisphaera sp.]